MTNKPELLLHQCCAPCSAGAVPVLEKEIALSEEELATLLMMLPDQKEIPGLLENVSRLGTKVGLENILFQPQPTLIP